MSRPTCTPSSAPPRAAATRSRGFSEGGTCAAMLALRHPTMFTGFADFSGLTSPSLTERVNAKVTALNLFDGSMTDYVAHDPLELLKTHNLHGGAYFQVGSNDASHLAAQRTLVALARKNRSDGVRRRDTQCWAHLRFLGPGPGRRTADPVGRAQRHHAPQTRLLNAQHGQSGRRVPGSRSQLTGRAARSQLSHISHLGYARRRWVLVMSDPTASASSDSVGGSRRSGRRCRLPGHYGPCPEPDPRRGQVRQADRDGGHGRPAVRRRPHRRSHLHRVRGR